MYKRIAVGLLQYQSSGQNSIFTLIIFIKLSYNYSFVGKKELTSSHVSSYADAFRKLSNNLLFIIAFHFAFKVTSCFLLKFSLQ